MFLGACVLQEWKKPVYVSLGLWLEFSADFGFHLIFRSLSYGLKEYEIDGLPALECVIHR